jgi:hypothetical protein
LLLPHAVHQLRAAGFFLHYVSMANEGDAVALIAGMALGEEARRAGAVLR